MGHVLISGKSGSGKSELVYTLLNRNKRDSAVYIIDYGGGRLKDIAGCPCCGGYIGDDDPDDIVRMTGFICEMLTRRRRGEDDGTSVILVLDDHVQIAAAADPEASEHITRIISHGRSTGIYVIATYVTIPAGRDTKLFDTRLCLGCEDSYAVALFLKSPARDIPRICDTPGRGVGVYNGTALEFQAVRVSGDEGYCLHGIKAPKYPHVPDKPTLDDLLVRAVAEYPPVSSIKAEMPEPVALPVGYDIKTGKLYTLPIGSISCILVAGKPYSGRHTFIFDISISAARYGINCIRADTYDSLITVCRESESITVVTINSITALLDEFYACPRSSEEEDELMFYFENPATNGMKKRSPVILVGIIENEARIRFSGRRVFESMIKHPYGISFGGSLDENRIFDYSYLSFSTMQMARKSHIATVLKFDEKSYFGNVIIPRDNQCG